MIHYDDCLHHDNREVLACLRYILFRCCKYKYEIHSDDEGESWCVANRVSMDFMQLKWILDRCNFKAGKDYGLKFFDYDMLFVLEDAELIPETFDCEDWSSYYITDDHGWIKKDKNGKLMKTKGLGSKEKDHLSGADVEIMNNVIFRWKLYGQWCVKLSNWWWKIKRPN